MKNRSYNRSEALTINKTCVLSKWTHDVLLKVREEIVKLEPLLFGLAIAEPECRVSKKKQQTEKGMNLRPARDFATKSWDRATNQQSGRHAGGPLDVFQPVVGCSAETINVPGHGEIRLVI